jgi:hypothetical protein
MVLILCHSLRLATLIAKDCMKFMTLPQLLIFLACLARFDSQGLYEIHDASTTAHFSGLFSAMSDLSLCIASQPTVDQAAFKSPEDSANAHALD